MAINTKIIKRRIGSIANTKKITKAMELVSASKMRKAVGSALSTRPYAVAAREMIGGILEARLEDEIRHPLTKARTPVKKTLAILITSHRGLCGGFNAQIIKLAAEEVMKRGGENIEFVSCGRRGENWLSRRGLQIKASFPELVEKPASKGVRPIAKMARDGFLDGTWDEVIILYTDFISAVSQKPCVRTLLPMAADIKPSGEAGQAAMKPSTLFEPDPSSVLERLLPHIVESQLLHAFLESAASEHSARMFAMQNATSNAADMLENLRFNFNQARQAGITREIAEISAGRAALE